MTQYLNIFTRIVTAATPRARAIPNMAGGYAFAIDNWARLDRLLILGSEGGSDYACEAELTRENAAGVPCRACRSIAPTRAADAVCAGARSPH